MFYANKTIFQLTINIYNYEKEITENNAPAMRPHSR